MDQLATCFEGRSPRVPVLCRLLLRLEPGVDARLDVALEDFGEVMVAVELVLVGDAGEGLNRSGGSHGSMMSSGIHGGHHLDMGLRLRGERIFHPLAIRAFVQPQR